MTQYFIRVRAGLVIERGWTDAAAFASMQEGSAEYRDVTREQYDSTKIGDPAPAA